MRSLKTGQRVGLVLKVRGKAIPVIEIRDAVALWESKMAFVTTKQGFNTVFSALPPYEDHLYDDDHLGSRFKTFYIKLDSDEMPKNDPDNRHKVEIHVDFPKTPEIKCHDCGELFYADQVAEIRLRELWKPDKPYSPDALRYSLTDDDIPAEVTETRDRDYYTFAICRERCAKERLALEVLAGEEEKE